MEVFSTITSPVFSELIFVIWHDQLVHLLSDAMLFETLRAMNEVRPLNLFFLIQIPHPPSREGQRRVELALEAVTAKGLLNFFDSPPSIRVVQPHPLVYPCP
jgi:hypothetical protein